MDGVRWEVDDRSLTWWTRVYVRGMRWRRDKQAFTGAEHTRETALKLQRTGDEAPTLPTRVRTRVTTTSVADMTVWVARPRRRRASVQVLYLHGGGYVHPLTGDYWRLVRALVGGGAEVVVPAYPLAPAHTVDDVLPMLAEVVRLRSAGEAPLPLVLMGDSAGGALALVLAQVARDRGWPAPVGIACLCPWLDATLDEERVRDLEPSDPMLEESGLRAAGRWWAGPRPADDPVVSPLWSDLAGLPPIDVYIGDRDILRPAVDDLVDRARSQDVELTIRETPALFHVWMTRLIPEGRRTRRSLVRLVRDRARVTRSG
jgi:epsilon-lactone hydrolase